MTATRARGLGTRQRALLREAAAEISRACPWVTIDGDRRNVRTLVRRGLMAMTADLFAITPAGCLAVRRHDRKLAKEALAGFRRNMAEGQVMPWDV